MYPSNLHPAVKDTVQQAYDTKGLFGVVHLFLDVLNTPRIPLDELVDLYTACSTVVNNPQFMESFQQEVESRVTDINRETFYFVSKLGDRALANLPNKG